VVRYVWYRASFFFQAEDGIRDATVTGVQTCALPISAGVTVAEPDVGARLFCGGVGVGVELAVVADAPPCFIAANSLRNSLICLSSSCTRCDISGEEVWAAPACP